MKITLPKGYRPPDGSKPGEPFEVVAVLVPSEDGMFSITTIDGVKLSDDKEEMEDEDEDEEEMDPFELVRKDDNPNFLGI